MLVMLVCSSAVLKAQPDYDFTTSIQVSGSGNPSNVMVGDVYRFLNVKPGVDALVTITDITGGITVSALDAGSGYPEALQPTLEVPPFTSGYLEMYFEFIDHTTDLPLTMAEVPVTCIDVDGMKDNDGLGNPLNEFDQINLGGGYVDYDLLGGELTVSQSGSWFNGTNIGGIDYPGRDTAAKQVMFTVVNANVPSFVIRVGANNQSTKQSTRLRSVYFKKFTYASGLLPVYADGLISFNGVKKENEVVLNWELTNLKEYRLIIIERATNNGNFEPIGQLIPSYDNMGKATGNFTDHPTLKGTVLYRLKMISKEGAPLYSNILMFKMNGVAGEFKVFPTVVDDAATIQITTAQKENITIRVVDYSGRIVLTKHYTAQNGQNSISLDGMSRFARGNYVVTVYASNEIHSQKMIKL